MQINIVRIRKDNFHETERICWSGLLPHHQAKRFYSFENFGADFIFRYDLAVRRDHLKIVLGDVIGIFLNMWHDFAALNAGRDFPVRPEDDVLNLFLKNRRFVAIGFSDDDVLIERDRAIRIHGPQPILGQIHDHGRLREGVRKPAPPF